MAPKILISKDLSLRTAEIQKILDEKGVSLNHPDLLYLEDEEKLGVLAVKKIREFLSLKPYSAKGRIVVLESADNFTPEAQNALLKTLEEPPEESLIILGAESENKFLPTVLSRCEIIGLDPGHLRSIASAAERSMSGMTGLDSIARQEAGGLIASLQKDIEKLQAQSIEERFEYIEKLEEKEEFLKALIVYYRRNLRLHLKGVNLEFVKKLMEAEKWQKANGNIRAILEYLMLKMSTLD